MKLDRDFREFCASLEAKGVRYLIVGGYAVAFHGHVRYTKDLDVWVEIAPDNAARIIEALRDFGFGEVNLKAEDFLTEHAIIQWATRRIAST